MNRIEVVSRVKVYEQNDRDVAPGDPAPILTVESHRIYSERVVLTDPNGLRITVIASDLLAAIRNATNAS